MADQKITQFTQRTDLADSDVFTIVHDPGSGSVNYKIQWTDVKSEIAEDLQHNNLQGLQGGTTNEYYHLTNTQHTELTGIDQPTQLSTTGDPTFSSLDLSASADSIEFTANQGIVGTTDDVTTAQYVGGGTPSYTLTVNGNQQIVVDSSKIEFPTQELQLTNSVSSKSKITVNTIVNYDNGATTVDGISIKALKNDVDGFPDALKNLTTSEINQLENINSQTISNTQWGYLGAMDQGISTSDNVTFNQLTTDTINENTAGSGVTVDSVLLKDDTVTAEGGTSTFTAASAKGVLSKHTSSATSSTVTALEIEHESSGDMVDGFGVSLDATLDDSAASSYMGHLAWIRDGSDTTSKAQLQIQNAGSDVNYSFGTSSLSVPSAVTLNVDTITEQTSANGVSIETVTIKDGNVDGVDVSALKTDVDGFPDELKNLTATEISELENIGSTTISATQWGYLGSLDQSVATSDDVTFSSADTTIVDSNGNLILGQTSVASAVNYVDITNAATGSGPTLSAAGTDTNINMNYSASGTGTHIFNNAIDIDNLKLDGNTLSSTNTDGNLVLDPNGTGKIDCGAHDLIIDGGQFVLDENGNEQLKFNASASAVNFIEVANADTGNRAELALRGDDTDVGLNINLKNSGTFAFNGETVGINSIKDEDDMSSDSDTALATQQSIKAYVDSQVFGSGGKYAQIKQATTTTTSSTSSTSYSDVTGLSVSITPTSSSNDVEVTISANTFVDMTSGDGNSEFSQNFRIMRDSTDITGDQSSYTTLADNQKHDGYGNVSFTIVDTPATTSSVTYKVQHATNTTLGGDGTAKIVDTGQGVIIAKEISGGLD